MALLAAPQQCAFVIEEKDAGMLKVKSNATLQAFRKIRKVETNSASPERLAELDRKIAELEHTGMRVC